MQVPSEVPLLLDLSKFDGMRTLLHPVFREFLLAIEAPTVCCGRAGSTRGRELEEIGAPASAIFATREEALVALGAAP